MNNPNINPKTINPLKRMCMTIGQLPSSYLETMSYYEMLVWFVEFLKNQIIPTLNNNAEAVRELQQLYIELKEYVDNYFDSTDFQSMVNQKIDEMAESGELLNILSNYANIQRLYDTFNDLYNDDEVSINQKVKCFGMLNINDGNGGEFLINDSNGIQLNNGLYALPLNYYEENFYDEVNFTQERYYDTDCYFTNIPLNDKYGNQINLSVNYRDYAGQSPLKYAQDNLTTVTLNGSLTIVNQEDSSKTGIPCMIGNGEILNNVSMYGESGVADNFLYIGIKANRDIVEFKVNDTTPEQLLANGCVNVFDCYYKLIENYMPLDLSNVVTNEAGVVTNRHPRQVLCEMQDKSILILTCDGRSAQSKGLTSEQMQEILINKSVKNAWNLDGGGSTSTEIKTIKINKNIDSHETVDRMIGYTLNVKKTTLNKNIADVYSYMSKMFQFFNKRYQEERIKTRNLNGTDANDLIGDFIIGCGTQIDNTPYNAVYFVNFTDTIILENRYLYNTQLCYSMNNYKIWKRQMVNGVWSEWINVSSPMSAIALTSGAYTLQSNATYEQIPLNSIVNYDGNSIILNNDNTFSFNDISNKLLYFECRITGSAGNKFIQLRKNGSATILQNLETDANKRTQLIFIAPLEINALTNKFSLWINGAENDKIEQCHIYIK